MEWMVEIMFDISNNHGKEKSDSVSYLSSMKFARGEKIV